MIKNVFKIICDENGCEYKDEYESLHNSFKDIITLAEDDGWYIIYNSINGRYNHYCPNCANKFL